MYGLSTRSKNQINFKSGDLIRIIQEDTDLGKKLLCDIANSGAEVLLIEHSIVLVIGGSVVSSESIILFNGRTYSIDACDLYNFEKVQK